MYNKRALLPALRTSAETLISLNAVIRCNSALSSLYTLHSPHYPVCTHCTARTFHFVHTAQPALFLNTYISAFLNFQFFPAMYQIDTWNSVSWKDRQGNVWVAGLLFGVSKLLCVLLYHLATVLKRTAERSDSRRVTKCFVTDSESCVGRKVGHLKTPTCHCVSNTNETAWQRSFAVGTVLDSFYFVCILF